jgi:hypothetical protein
MCRQPPNGAIKVCLIAGKQYINGVPIMSVLRIDIAGNPKTIPYRDFLCVANNCLGILDQLDLALSHRRTSGTLEWYMNDLSSADRLRLEIYSRPRQMQSESLPDIAHNVTNHFITGFRVLEKEGRSPAYLSDLGMKKAEWMTDVLGHNGAQAIVASDIGSNQEVEITRQSALNLEKLILVAAESLGSVEGTLEDISIHKGNHFVVYEAITGKGVRVKFPSIDLIGKAKEYLGSRVRVSGILFRNAKNEPVQLVIQDTSGLKVFGSDLEIRDLKELGGSDPDFTGDLSTEEFIRGIRG